MKSIYYTASSLDGFIADENNGLEWLFLHGDADEETADFSAFMGGIGAMAMGSTTYEWVFEHEQLREHPEKWMYDVPAWVFSRRDLPAVAGADIRFVRGDVEPVHEAMRTAAGEKNIWLLGGGDLVGQFHEAGHLDEIVVTIAPATLGAGAPLLPRRIVEPPMKLVDVRRYAGVFAQLTYAVVR